MSNYWDKRAARQMHNQMQKAEDYAKDLAKYYIAASQHLKSEQNAILRRFALTHHMTIKDAEKLISSLKDPNDIKALIKELKKDPNNAELVREFEAQAARSRIMRLNALQDQVTYTAGQIQILLNKKAQKLFVNLAKSAYYHTMFDAMQRAGYGFNVKMLDPKRIKRVMDRSWAGSGFSKRLWGNTKALEDAVKREIMINLLTGRPLLKASQAIDEQFSHGFNNARRLIRTESAYITNQMTLEGYKDLEADKYIYVAILDLKTSEVCRSLDKKRFLVSSAKVGVNYPPMHPWCRSTTIPWMPDHLLKNIKQRALDPRTGKHVLVPGDMTYEEWYKQFVQGQPAGDPTTRTIAAGSGTIAGSVTPGSDTISFANNTGTDTSMFGDYTQKSVVDVTKEWSDNINKNTENVADSDTYTAPDGTVYDKRTDSDVILDPEEHERETGGLLSKATGKKVYMIPRVTGRHKNVSTPDFETEDGEKWDKKRPEGKGKRAIKDMITAAKEQADNFIIDISKWKGDRQNAIEQAERILYQYDTEFVKKIAIIDDKHFIEAFERQ